MLLLGLATWAVLAVPEAIGAPITLLWSGFLGLPVVELVFCVLWLPTLLVSRPMQRARRGPRLAAWVAVLSVIWGTFGAATMGGPDYVIPFAIFAVEGLVYSGAFLWQRGRRSAVSS